MLRNASHVVRQITFSPMQALYYYCNTHLMVIILLNGCRHPPPQLNVTVGQSVGFLCMATGVPGWFCGDALFTFILGGGGSVVIETLTGLDHQKQPGDRDVQAGCAHAFRLQCKFNRYCSRSGRLGGRLLVVLVKPACGR